jgi:hypothetical protein
VSTPLFPDGGQAIWEAAKPFQIEDAEYVLQYGHSVLGHKTGLGKTFISMMCMAKWAPERTLLVGTTSSCATWERQLLRWGGVKPVFMQGKTNADWNAAVKGAPGVYSCTFATFRYLMAPYESGKVHFDLVVDDELHRAMRHRNATVAAHNRLRYKNYLGLSATWSSRGPQDCYPVLHLMDRRQFPSYWRFVNTWCHVERTEGMGTQIFGVRNVENLRALLRRGFYRTRTWPEVGGQFREGSDKPPIVRRRVKLPMSKEQSKMYDTFHADMMMSLGDVTVITQNELVKLTRLLQVAVSPKILFPDADVGPGIRYLCDQVSEDPHVVIFCPYTEALPIIREALIGDGYPAHAIFMMHGQMRLSPTDINDTIAKWKKVSGVMLLTVAFAQSFETDTTFNAYMLGFSWDPNDNEQAEGRLRRMDSLIQVPCVVNYIIPEGSEFERVEDVVDGKMRNTSQYMLGLKA